MFVGLEAVQRAGLWPTGKVDYSQNDLWQDDYRQDCSGFVSMCWGLPAPGENTESLVTKELMVQIDFVDLRPGDAIGLCGPGTLGDFGHIMLFLRFRPSGGLDIAEQAGGQPGPVYRTLKRIPEGYLAYRLNTPTQTPTAMEDDIGRLIKRSDGAWFYTDFIWREHLSPERLAEYKRVGVPVVEGNVEDSLYGQEIEPAKLVAALLKRG